MRVGSRVASLAVRWLLAGAVLGPGALAIAVPHGEERAVLEDAFASILTDQIEAHVLALAHPSMEGRDAPGRGAERAAQYIAERFAMAGLAAAADSLERWAAVAGDAAPEWSIAPVEAGAGTYLRPFRLNGFGGRKFLRPLAGQCQLELHSEAGDGGAFALGTDFVPVLDLDGSGEGELVFAGFGIERGRDKYDDFRGLRLEGKVVLVLEGEPRHPRRFEGEDWTEEAALWRKVERAAEAQAAALIVARRAPADGVAAAPLSYRHDWAMWQGEAPDPAPRRRLPVLEVSAACASRLLGEDVEALAERIDRSAKPQSREPKGRRVRFRATTEEASLVLSNVVARIPGCDEALASEWVVVGAHYDHVGVGPRGRIALGADDNASGTSALIEIGEALAGLQPRRSLLLAAFTAEEDGLVGAGELLADGLLAPERVVGMLNMDMIGRGKRNTVGLLGAQHNPDLERLARAARKLGPTGITRLEPSSDAGLFQRSDHFRFHELGIPSLFFMEELPLATNREYHTWKDTVDLLDMAKIANTARLVFATAWLLANEDSRPARPRD